MNANEPDGPAYFGPGSIFEWECACGEMTVRSHWRCGADGAMFHAGPDAPPSDPAPIRNESSERGEV